MIARNIAADKECKSSEDATMESMTVFTKISDVEPKISKCVKNVQPLKVCNSSIHNE